MTKSEEVLVGDTAENRPQMSARIQLARMIGTQQSVDVSNFLQQHPLTRLYMESGDVLVGIGTCIAKLLSSWLYQANRTCGLSEAATALMRDVALSLKTEGINLKIQISIVDEKQKEAPREEEAGQSDPSQE